MGAPIFVKKERKDYIYNINIGKKNLAKYSSFKNCVSIDGVKLLKVQNFFVLTCIMYLIFVNIMFN